MFAKYFLTVPGIVVVVSTGALVGVSWLKLTGVPRGMDLTALMGRALSPLIPLIWMGIAPWGSVFPAKMMLRPPEKINCQVQFTFNQSGKRTGGC